MSENLYSKKIGKNQIGLFSYNNELLKNKYNSRYSVFIGTACTGLVRMEWAMARFGQIIPCNWGYKSAITWVPSFAPMGYLVADAQNLIVRRFMEENCEWLFLIEQDNVLPADCFLRMNEYIRKKQVPIVSGLYFTKSYPAEPMIYKGRGNSYSEDWKIGDKVWVDAVPTGCVIIHRSILEYLWNNSPEYVTGNQTTRRVFHTPEMCFTDPELGVYNSVGTSDMEFCARIIEEKVFEKTGWSKFAKMDHPFLVDTSIFIGHIDENGKTYPSQEEFKYWSQNPKSRKKLI